MSDQKTWQVDEWTGCYPSKWKGVIVPEAMAHPAKFSSRLIRRIYEHLFEMEWVKAGSHILDPFGGVGLGALNAMEMGLCWTGVELEPKFVGLGTRNIERWNAKFRNLPRWSGQASLLQGDSRKLGQVVRGNGDVAVSSPPYTGSVQLEKNSTGIDWERQYETYKKSWGGQSFQAFVKTQEFHSQGYGESEGQLGAMPSSPDSFDAALSSPPFESHLSADFLDADSRRKYARELGISNAEHISPIDMESIGGREQKDARYGFTDGQLGAMPSSPDSFQAALSTPPYKNGTEGGGLNVDKPETFRGVLRDGSLSMGESEGNLGRMDDGNFQAVVSSSPYVGGGHHPDQIGAYNKNGGGQGQEIDESGYGSEDGQLGKMYATPNGFEAAISSPPFRQSEGGTPEPKAGGVIDARLYERHAAGNSAAEGYGATDGQLANMQEGDFEGVVSSPPYENSDLTYNKNGLIYDGEPYKRPYMEGQGEKTYGETNGQLSGTDDFWLAARQIVEQVYAALEPGGHAVWVCKDFVREKMRVPFSDQWRQLCEAVGFMTVHEHRALLVKDRGTSLTLDGGSVQHKTESKSFFRRLAEKKGSPRVDWETVYCMEKPKNE